MFRSPAIALAFLTILPLRVRGEISADDLRQSAAWFPLAGWLLGGAIGLVLILGAWLKLPALVTAVIAVATAAWLTRGLHLDGLADCFDALGGGATPERRLAIMKDSMVGAFGVSALLLLLLLKSGCLAGLTPAAAGSAGLLSGNQSMAGSAWLLVLAPPVAARWAMIILAASGRYPRPTGTGHFLVGRAGKREMLIGTLLLLPLAPAGLPVLAVILATCLPALWLGLTAPRRFGGITGDLLGAACELGEAAGWLAALLYLARL